MIHWTAAAALSLLVGGASAAAPAPETRQFAQLIIREQIIIKVPVRNRETAPAAASSRRWREGRGPECVAARSIVGASLLSENSVDLILREGKRVRARLSSRCPALDYYYGFYIRPNQDGMICAERDIIRSRMGGQCGIERFRSLEAVASD